jgi:hypothetical protein
MLLAEDGWRPPGLFGVLKTNCPYELVFLPGRCPALTAEDLQAIRIMEEVAEIEPEKKAKIVLTAVIAKRFPAGSTGQRKQPDSNGRLIFKRNEHTIYQNIFSAALVCEHQAFVALSELSC